MKYKNPRWIPLAAEVLASLDSGTRSSKSDGTTRRITETVIKTLLRGQSLSDSLAATFIENIRRRTGRESFVWTEKVKLSRDQRLKGCKQFPQFAPDIKPYETSTASTSGFVTRAEYDDLSTRVAFLESLLLQMSTQSLPNVDAKSTQSLPDGQEMALYAAENSGSGTSKSDATERNATKHHESMTSPNGSSPHGHESEAHAPSTSKSHEGNKSHKPALTIYAKSDAVGNPSVSGNLDLHGIKYRLVFSCFDLTMEKLAKLSSKDSAAFRSYLNNDYGAAIATSERSAVGYARNTTSALYDTKDSRGYKAPVADTTMVALCWEANEPISAIIFDGLEKVLVPLSKSNHANHPYFKGYVE